MFEINAKYEFEKIDENLVAINAEDEKVIVFGKIEQFILEHIVTTSEEELIRILKNEYGDEEKIENDVYEFVEELIREKIILLKEG